MKRAKKKKVLFCRHGDNTPVDAALQKLSENGTDYDRIIESYEQEKTIH